MFTLLRKEINSFFSSLIGYLVVIVFLLANGLFMWVFPGDMNILDSGYATLAPLFDFAPWIFLFLIPAVTMRLFAEEKRTGTIELLYTRPLSDLQVVLAKYLAGVVLVVLSLLPTLIYFFSVSELGAQPGNIDVGGTWGSFIGLLFLSAVYIALGVFSSSITDNQIVAFILSVVFSFMFYTGFEALASLSFWGNSSDIIENIGINAHYISLSRGVVDSRDLVYFLSVIALVIWFTTFNMKRSRTAG